MTSIVIGQTLSHYEILEKIGAGGMGDVYRATDTRLGRDVAIKVLPDAFSEDTERLERFEREARLLAQLNHANIATLHGFEEASGKRFLVMELVDGESLSERMAGGRLPIAEIIPLFLQIAEGLAAAHEKDIVHRDLKPANIMITPDGQPKILDFGLAKAFTSEEASSDERADSPTLTKGTALGAILGTATYMSPEQARGKSVDARSDVWAFGCCLYETLTGARAFDGETLTDTLAKVVQSEPDWEALPAETPARVRNVLKRCLQKDKKRRYHHMADARLDLMDAESVPVAASPPATRNRTVTLLVAAVVGSVLTAAAFIGFGTRAPVESNAVTRASVLLGGALSLGLNPSVAISPDGRTIAYTLTDANFFRGVSGRPGLGSTRSLYLRSLDESEPRIVENSQLAVAPFFSPDGQWIGFHANDALMRASVSGGAPTPIARVGADLRGAYWSEDDTIYFTPRAGLGIWTVPAEGGSPTVLTTPNAAAREKSHRNPVALPGGRAVLFTLGSGDIELWDEGSVAVLSLETGTYRVLIEGGMNPRYLDSGHLVYARAGTLLAVPFDLTTLEVTGAPVVVVEGVITSPHGANAHYGVSRSGHLLFAPGSIDSNEQDIGLVDRRTGEFAELFTALAITPRFSPDGRRILTWVVSANDTVTIYDLERGVRTEIARGFDNRFPQWSPDGERVVFTSNRTGAFNLFTVAADGSTDPERLVTSENAQALGSWSPDGERVAFSEERPETGSDIHILSVTNATVTPFVQSNANETDPQFSPDGQWIAYVTDATGREEIEVRSFGGTGRVWQASSEGGSVPRWNPNGRELLYLSGDRLMSVAVNPSSGPFLGRPQVVLEDSAVVDFDVSPDGQRFVLARPREDPAGPTELSLVLQWSEELKLLAPTN